MAKALQLMPFPVLLCDAGLETTWQNEAAEQSEGLAALLSGSALLSDGRKLSVCLAELASRLRDDDQPKSEATVRFEGRDLHIVVKPINADGDDTFLVVLQTRAGETALPPALHNMLTATERRLVILLSAGSTLREAASDMRISYHTARKYIQTIFDKTSVRRQTDLVALALGRSGRN